MPGLVVEAICSGSLQAGQWLAKPGLSGFSSNSSEQTAQTRIGNAIKLSFYNPCRTSLYRSSRGICCRVRAIMRKPSSYGILPFCPPIPINARIITMRKLSLTAASTLTVCIMLLGNVVAQQTPASTPKPAPSAKTSTTATPHPATAAKSTAAPEIDDTERQGKLCHRHEHGAEHEEGFARP